MRKVPVPKIYPRGRRWWVRFTWSDNIGPSVDIRWPAGESRSEAASLSANIIKGIEAGTFDGTRESVGIEVPKPQSKRVTFGDLLDKWEESQEAKSRNMETVRQRLKQIRKHFTDRLGVPAEAIRPAEITEYVNGLHAAHPTPTTGNRIQSALSAAFNYGVANEYVRSSPVRVKKVSEEATKRPPFPLMPEQYARVLEACDPEVDGIGADLADVVTFLCHTGLRRGELVNVLRDDVDLEARRLTVRRTKARKPRTVPLPDAAVAVVKRQPERGDYLFTRDEDGRPLVKGDLTDAFGAAVRRAGISRRRRKGKVLEIRTEYPVLHDTRHTFAVWLTVGGAHPILLKRLMGHASVKTTEIYADWAPDRDGVAVAIMNRTIPAQSPETAPAPRVANGE